MPEFITVGLFLWTDCDINGYFVENLSILEDGTYYATVEDWENEDRCIVLLRKTRGEEVMKIIQNRIQLYVNEHR